MMLRGVFLQALQSVFPCANATIVFSLQYLNAALKASKPQAERIASVVSNR